MDYKSDDMDSLIVDGYIERWGFINGKQIYGIMHDIVLDGESLYKGDCIQIAMRSTAWVKVE
jgi:hypothetical protein